jgi:hypothetical protein
MRPAASARRCSSLVARISCSSWRWAETSSDSPTMATTRPDSSRTARSTTAIRSIRPSLWRAQKSPDHSAPTLTRSMTAPASRVSDSGTRTSTTLRPTASSAVQP